jgi:hypothetical protein
LVTLDEQLYETEGMFFRAGAETVAVDGAFVSWLPGLVHLAAGVVVHDVDVAVVADPGPWVDSVEAVLRSAGAAYSRIYVRGPADDLASCLAGRGYRARDEIGFAFPAGRPPRRPDVSLRPVDDWSEKLALHERAGPATATYDVPADEWVALERRRAESGVVVPWFIEVGGAVVGSLGAIYPAGVVRAKNLLVEPDRRLVGVGTEALRQLLLTGPGVERSAAVFYAVEGSRAEGGYRHTGLPEIGRQTEWVRAL